jgi:2-methylcitrate dehydratase
MDSVTKVIAEYASTSAFAQLSKEAIHAAKQRLIDSLACAVGAHGCEPAQIGRRLAAGQTPGKYSGRLLCFGDRLPVESAAFINTSMIRNFDFNDRYPGGHPSDCLGALLAMAGGAMDIDGKRFLVSMIVAYEIFARLSDASALSRRGWDQGYAVGIATCAAVCNLLKISPAATAHAVGIAAASNLPLRVTRSGELTPWKNAATAYAMRNGVFAALLGAEGMSGPGNAFEGRNGLFEKVTGPFELALELREKAQIHELKQIEVFTSKFTWFEIGSEPEKWDPQTRETADHSLPYIFARTLADGPIRITSFADDAVRDQRLRPLMSKIKVIPDDRIEALLPQKAFMRVVATTLEGGQHVVEVSNPLGHPDNPMQDRHIEEKFIDLVEPALGKTRCRAALDSWWRLVTRPK